VDSRELRRLRRRQALRRRRIAVALTVSASLLSVTLIACRPTTAANQPAARPKPHRPVPWRPPQFVVVSFDGSGGVRLWPYWRSVARRAHAHFTFFVSGVYLLDEARRSRYRPPRHRPGSSDIGFAESPQLVRGMLSQIAAAHREGHEIGTHFNGHFCAPYEGNVGEWSAVDWRRELGEFFKLLFRAPARLPFGPEDVIGGRTPCLEGNLRLLYPVLARHGFRYDASQVGPLGDWPRRELGLWSTPLLEIQFVGHSYDVVSMDYNFLANQTGLSPATIERETFLSLRQAFLTSYFGERAPLSIGVHFETWRAWAYDHAVTRLLLGVCRLPEVRCVSYRELVGWLDAQPPRLLRRARAGRFRRLKRP
jgi:hypothetical protein